MSKWPMWGHFGHLHFKSFPMTPRTPQGDVFSPLPSNSKDSGVPEDSKSPTLGSVNFILTLGPKWGLRHRWTSKTSESDCKGQNPLPCGSLYIIRNLLKLTCLKWARMTHLDIYNTSYDQKKGWESNWQFDSWPWKVRNRPDSFACRWRATRRWKAVGLLALAILGLPFGSPGTRKHSDATPAEWCRIYYVR
jgi:hypothetical protein